MLVFREILQTYQRNDPYGHNFLYTAYAHDSSFFSEIKKSVIGAFKTLNKFSQLFSELRPNKGKCEVAGTGVKKGVKVALCGMKNVGLKNSKFIIFTTKNLKMKRISKIIYRK